MDEHTMHQLMNPKSHHNVGLNCDVVELLQGTF